MKQLIKLSVLALSVSTLLTACGGGGGDSTSTPVSTTPPPVTVTPEPMKISGNVIDGYIIGATIFMDLNFNSKLDDGEPFAVTVEPTKENPGWIMEIPGVHEDCGQYVPFVTDVPVGAIDLDDPENPITEAYQMVIPPSFAVTSNENMKNVTPLTSVLWKTIEREMAKEETELSCEGIIANEKLRKKVTQRVVDQEKRVAKRYNTTVSSLYSDYVKTNNGTLHGLARSLVPGLAKGYEDSIALEKANPRAELAYVDYYFESQGEIAQEKWTRLEFIQTERGNWDEVANAMTQGLGSIGKVKFRNQQRTSKVSGLDTEVAISFNGGQCTITEYFTELNGDAGYALANIAGATDLSWNDCFNLDRVANNTSQLLMTKTFYSDGTTVKTESGHQYYGENEYKFAEMIGAKADDLNGGWLSSNLSHIALSFEDSYDYNADTWYRVDNRYDSENFWEEDQVVHMHDDADEYTVTTYRPDGTFTKQCGTWSGGVGSLTGC